MQEFTVLKSSATPLPINNIDTDQIIPARYLLMITKDGYGDHLFNDWRYDTNNNEKEDFILNDTRYSRSQILITGDSFGIGSSREHAVWAIMQFGFRVVIAPSFGPIFKNNSFGNGLLLIELKQNIIDNLTQKSIKNPNYTYTIDLPAQTVTTEEGDKFSFDIDEYNKSKLLKGLDNIGYILEKSEYIKKYESNNE